MKAIDTPDKLFDKEYHFDEGMGQSLNEHVAELKENHPDMKVATRRDRDGFAIVKTTYKREFKYDLNEILNFDAEKETEHAMTTLELVLSHILPATKPSED